MAADAVCTTHSRKFGAGNDRRVSVCVAKRHGAHGSAGAFSVHSGHADTPLVACHQISEEIRARYARDTAAERRLVLRIIRRHGDGIDDCIIAFDVRRIMRVKYLDAALRQTVGQLGLGTVGASDAISADMRNVRKRRHCYATDADKKYTAAALKHSADLCCSVMCIWC